MELNKLQELFLTRYELQLQKLEYEELKNQKEVDENMQDYHTMTLTSFGKRVTFVEVRMKNGFTLRETECPVDDSNYDEKVGEKMCLEKIKQKVWTLLGYALKEKLSK